MFTGCMAIPLHVEGTSQFYVTLFFAPFPLYEPKLVQEIQDKAIQVVGRVLQSGDAPVTSSSPTPCLLGSSPAMPALKSSVLHAYMAATSGSQSSDGCDRGACASGYTCAPSAWAARNLRAG